MSIPLDGLPRAERVHVTDLKRVAITDHQTGPAHSTDLDVQIRPLGWELVWPSAPNAVADAVRKHWETWKDYAFPWPDGDRLWQAQWDGPPVFRGVSATHSSITVRLRNTSKPPSESGGGGGAGTHALGLNLGQFRVWAPGLPYVDLARAAQPWWNQRNGSDWNQNLAPSLADADGYPTTMPGEGWWASAVMTGQSGYPGGVYTAYYDGVGSLAFGGDAVVVSTNPGVVVLAITPNAGFWLRITATQPGNHLRNLRILPGNGGGGGGGGGGTHLLGLNIGYFRIWAPGTVYLDLARNAQPWWLQLNGSYWSQNTPASPVDADCYPTAPAPSGWWATVLLINQPSYQAGRYIATYDGEGTLEFARDAVVVTAQPGRIELDITPTNEGIHIRLTATTVGNHLRNLRIRLA